VKVIKVSSSSRTSAVAGSIAKMIRERQDRAVSVNAIGARAVNQGVKAVALANKYLAGEGITIVCQPQFGEVLLEDGRERTTIHLIVHTIKSLAEGQPVARSARLRV